MTESFLATLECELLDRTRFCNRGGARQALLEFIGGLYNTRHRHGTFGQSSRIWFER